MIRPSSFLSFQPARSARSSVQTPHGVADFLRTNDKLASLLPVVARMTALEQDCKSVLPAVFGACSVIQFTTGRLTLAAPNASLAAKLKQQLPKLQEKMLERGWQVTAIRIKLQAGNILEKTPKPKQLTMPAQALSALASLKESLENSPRNEQLKAALDTLLARHRQQK